MSKVWLVARHEYFLNLRRPSFLFAAFGTPLIMIAAIAISFLIFSTDDSNEVLQTEIEAGTYQVGYVDHTTVINPELVSEDLIPYPALFQPYENEEAARAALDAETLDAYFVLPEDYIASGRVTIYSYETTPELLSDYIGDFMAAQLSSTIDNGQLPAARFHNPVTDLEVRIEDTGREILAESMIILIIAPFLFAIIFTLASQVTSSFLMGGLVDERVNRIMEVLITSITPMQLLSGKIIGLGLLGLTQLSVWVVMAVIGFVVFQDESFLQGVAFPVDLILYALLYFLLGYFLTSTLMAGIGAVVGSEQESRQYAGMVSLVLFLPYFFITSFFTNPGGTAPTLLSIFPFTAPMAMIMRIGLTSVPLWQIALSVTLLVVTSLAIAWLSAKVFRWGLLLTGAKITPRMIWQVIRGDVDMGVVYTQNKEVAS